MVKVVCIAGAQAYTFNFKGVGKTAADIALMRNEARQVFHWAFQKYPKRIHILRLTKASRN